MTLYELNNLVHETLCEAFCEPVWVQGELLEGRAAYGGHFYGELIEREEGGEQVVARARITIWARVYNLLSMRFHDETGQTLHPGIRVMFKVKVAFHEQYGYSLNVLDVDSRYTLGDTARRRQEILSQLDKDGILHDNQTLPLPTLISHIAVISSPTAAGYQDFVRQLENNEYGFRFDIRLFPAVMQGQHAAESVIASLEQILDVRHDTGQAHEPDVVIIIRGGGATADLTDFDSYPLAACVAQYPLPVLVGIGHDRDETVLDHVAHTSVKTPTAAAAFIVERQCEALSELQRLQQQIPEMARRLLEAQKAKIDRFTANLPLLSGRVGERHRHRLDMAWQRLAASAPVLVERHRHRLDLIDVKVKSLDPDLLLERGYSITTCGGRLITGKSELAPGEIITSRFRDGEILSKVICDK